jgi:hypothetical protein
MFDPLTFFGCPKRLCLHQKGLLGLVTDFAREETRSGDIHVPTSPLSGFDPGYERFGERACAFCSLDQNIKGCRPGWYACFHLFL